MAIKKSNEMGFGPALLLIGVLAAGGWMYNAVTGHPAESLRDLMAKAEKRGLSCSEGGTDVSGAEFATCLTTLSEPVRLEWFGQTGDGAEAEQMLNNAGWYTVRGGAWVVGAKTIATAQSVARDL